MEDEVNKYLLVGADLRSDNTHGNPLEIIYKRINADTINVFQRHALPQILVRSWQFERGHYG
jgi:hypothetical protein